jgi:hypothetical protein
MDQLNRSMIRILIMGWICFALAGFGLATFATPNLVVLLDRSYCPPDQWQQVIQKYDQIYQQNRGKQVRLKTVVLFSSLGEDVRTTPPTPTELQNLQPFGRPDPQKQSQLKTQYPDAILLLCGG